MKRRSVPVRNAAAARRGMTVLVVMLMISITLALSYAMLRSEATDVQIQSNSHRAQAAHQAALTGLAAGLRRMHRSDWIGVDVETTYSLSSTESYTLTYTTGDPSLGPAHPDFAQWPYRVTLLSVGTAADPSNPQLVSTHRVQAVLQLVPRAVTAGPSDWAATLAYTIYQTGWQDAVFHTPLRIEGNLRLQGDFELSSGYLWLTDPKTRYYSDLAAMYAQGVADYRPFTGQISIPNSRIDSTTRSILTSSLGLTVNNIASTSASSLSLLDSLLVYQLYPGGVWYAIPQLTGTVQNTQLAPDPYTNPLGVYFAAGRVTLGDNVTLQGTLLGSDDVEVASTSVTLAPFDAPNVAGASGPLRLPTVAVRDDFVVKSTGGGTTTGVVIAGDRFEISRGAQTAAFDLRGRIVAAELLFDERSNWDLMSGIWALSYTGFLTQLTNPPASRVNHYPLWLQNYGLSNQPHLTIRPETTTYRSHWQDLTQPIYVPASGDQGLQWNLVSVKDNP